MVMSFDPHQRIAELELALEARNQTIVRLELALAAAVARIEELEARLNRNSKNSNTPPSANPPGAPKTTVQKKSGKKQGGQPGHPGHHRAIVSPDVVVDHFPTACHECQASLPESNEVYRAHQVTEIPPVCVIVTEHRLHRTHCPHCGHLNRADLPAGIPIGQFGPRLTAAVAMLSGRYRQSRREVASVLEQLFGLSLSVGAIQTLCENAAKALAPIREEVAQVVLGQCSSRETVALLGRAQEGGLCRRRLLVE